MPTSYVSQSKLQGAALDVAVSVCSTSAVFGMAWEEQRARGLTLGVVVLQRGGAVRRLLHLRAVRLALVARDRSGYNRRKFKIRFIGQFVLLVKFLCNPRASAL